MVVFNHVPDFPSLEIAIRNTGRVVLIDNGSGVAVRSQLATFCQGFPDRCVLIENGRNLGLAAAFNRVVRGLMAEGFDGFYFLDHDAILLEDFFSETRRLWSALEAQGQNVGVVVPIVTDESAYIGGRMGFRSPHSYLQSTMTSGILTHARVFSALGGFDERLFVDAVDLDFTERANRAGFRVCRVNRVLIQQQFGYTPQDARGAARVGDLAMKIRSLVRVGIGNSNMFRTRLLVYPPRRRRDLYAALRWIISEGYPWRNLARLTYMLGRAEEFYVRHFVKPDALELGPLPPTPEPRSAFHAPVRQGPN